MASANPRRSQRITEKVVSTIVSSGTSKKRERQTTNKKNELHYLENEELLEELETVEVITEKPSELFGPHDVDGGTMYQTSDTVKHNAMLKKVAECQQQRTPIKPDKDLKVLLENLNIDEKKKVKQKASKILVETSDEEKCTSKKSNASKKSKTEDLEEEAGSSRQLRSRNKVIKEYHLETEEYFAKQSEKSITSNHTLSKLKNRHMDEEQLQKLLENDNHISDVHKKQIQMFVKTLELSYLEWFRIMNEGFNVLLYGLGSKRVIINNFHKKMIPDEPTIIVNGFFPSLTVKSVLDGIIVDLIGSEPGGTAGECFDIIKETMEEHPDDHIYVLVHNIDGGMLRSSKAQDVLSRLASIPNVHFLASIDHINAPLIWDNVKRARYNFYWVEATTFLPYVAETSYENSLLIQKNGALALLSLQNVFASLTSNAKAIYIILAKYQLENGGSNYTGMAFKDLHRAAREGFLVSSDQALRSQLTEFIDHKLVKTKRNHEGIESLVIPLDDALLTQFLEQQES